MPACCNNPCNNPCVSCDIVTNVVFKPRSCEGKFLFAPDLYTCPGVTGSVVGNTEICPLDVNVQINCKGDYKLTLLDDNGCNLDCIVLKCSQYDVSTIDADFVGVTAVQALFTGATAQGFTEVFNINANNLNLVGQYVAFEEAAYFYRQVCQAYQNLWCGAEKNGIVCQIIQDVKDITKQIVGVTQTQNTTTLSQKAFALGQDLLKSRVVALKQLCECGKVCNDQFFPIQTTPCQALKGCCPPRYH